MNGERAPAGMRPPKPVLVGVVSILLSAPWTAGCIETARAGWDDVRSGVGLPPEEISAKSALDEADEVAAGWRDGGRLAEVLALETANEAMVEDMGVNASTDPDVGNGFATVWYFHYVSGNASLLVGVRADGEIVERREMHRGSPAGADDATEARDERLASVDAWIVDSDAAIESLAANETWQETTANATKEFQMEGLTFDTGEASPDEPFAHPEVAWFVVLADREGRGAIGIVDAGSGDVLMVTPFPDFDWGFSWGNENACGGGDCRSMASYYEDSFVGDLTIFEPEDEYEFPVSEAGAAIEIALSAMETRPVGGVALAIRGPDGKDVPLEAENASPFSGPGRFVATATAPGVHTLVVSLEAPSPYASYSAHLTVGGETGGEWCCGAARAPTSVPAVRALPPLGGVTR